MKYEYLGGIIPT